MKTEKIDYLTVTHPECTTDQIIYEFKKIPKTDNLLRIMRDDETDENKLEKIGKFKRISPHYKNHYGWFHGSGIATNLNTDNSGENQMLINISGVGMEVFRSFEYSDIQIFQNLHRIGFKATRFDFSLDFYNPKQWQELTQSLRENRYITRTKSMNVIVDPISKEVETIYIGSQKNREVLICIYDKRKEQNKKILERSKKEKKYYKFIKTPWYRIEIRFYNGSKNKVCSELFEKIINEAKTDEDLNQICRGKILKFFRFIERGELDNYEFSPKQNAWGSHEKGKFKRIKNVQRLKTAKFWSDIVGDDRTDLQPKELINLYEHYVDTFNIQVSKRFLKRWMATWTEEERELIANIENKEDKKRVLAAMASRSEKLFEDLFSYGVDHWKLDDQKFVDQVLAPNIKKNPYPHLEESA